MAELVSAIQAEGLSKVFQRRAVLKNVNFEVTSADCVAILGANGCGKTTLLRCLGGAIQPSSGTLLWYGQRVGRRSRIRRLIGYVAHEPHVYPRMTVRENLVFAARMNDVHDPRRRVNALLEQTELAPVADQLSASISRGMRQRLMIGRAIVHDPPILLLDEPFSGLDSHGREWLVGLIRLHALRGTTVCFTCHCADIWQQLAQRTVLLQAGELLDGPQHRCVADRSTAA
jgi:heme ABC exporter ATP-binding subunit CcmA